MMATLPIESSILGTLLEVKYLNTLPGAHWECTTRIYVPRKEVWSITQDITNVVIEALDGSTKLRLPYASEFFAAFFTGLSQTQYSTERQAHPNSFHICRKQEKEAMAAVGGITVIQELFASTSNFGTKERIAIILSEFTKVEAYQPGIAQWREVIPPLTSATAPPAPVSPLISPAAILNYAEEWPLYTPTYDCFSMHYNNSPYFSPMDDSSNYSTSCGTSFDEGSASQGSPVAPPSSARDSFSFQNYMSEASYSVQDIPQNQQHQQRQQHPHGDVSCSMTVSGASTTSSHMPPMCPPTTTDFFATTLAATGSMQDWVNNTRNI